MADTPSFSKLIPGFDFLQDLAKGAGIAVPGMGAGIGSGATPAMPGFGQWVAPTLNPEELGKRIEELKTVQFWLEQNARLLGATIQALEVQRMTLSTLKTMNVQMGDLRDSMMAQVPEALKPKSAESSANIAEPPASKPSSGAATEPAAAAAAVDPMQWWSALTEQFTQLAASALKDGSAKATEQMAKVDLSAFQMPAVMPASVSKKASAATAGKAAKSAAKAPSHAKGAAARKATKR